MQVSPSLLLDAAAPFREGGGLPVLPGAAPTQDVGEQFESLFVSMLLKEMRASLSEGGLFAGDSADVYGGMFDMFLGQHIASQGAFGIAEMINRQVAGREDAAPAEPQRKDGPLAASLDEESVPQAQA
jgi:peptidoglycan hydrolase FlgJ